MYAFDREIITGGSDRYLPSGLSPLTAPAPALLLSDTFFEEGSAGRLLLLAAGRMRASSACPSPTPSSRSVRTSPSSNTQSPPVPLLPATALRSQWAIGVVAAAWMPATAPTPQGCSGVAAPAGRKGVALEPVAAAAEVAWRVAMCSAAAEPLEGWAVPVSGWAVPFTLSLRSCNWPYETLGMPAATSSRLRRWRSKPSVRLSCTSSSSLLSALPSSTPPPALPSPPPPPTRTVGVPAAAATPDAPSRAPARFSMVTASAHD